MMLGSKSLSGLTRSLSTGLATVCLYCGATPPAPIAEMMHAAGLGSEHLGLVIWRLDEAAPRFVNQPVTPFAPASTMKVVTTQVALDTLGPAWRARTEFFATAPIVDGVLRGHLVLRAGGAPDFDRLSLQRLLEQVRHAGIAEIAGDIVVDRTHFSPSRIDLGLAPFDEAPEFRYNVIPDALLLNQHLVGINVSTRTADIGMPALRASLLDPLENVLIETDEMTLADVPCNQWESVWQVPYVVRRGWTGDTDNAAQLVIRLRGGFPRDCAQTLQLNVLDAADHSDRMLRGIWHHLGGSLRGIVRERLLGESLTMSGKPLASHLSRPLGEIVRDINKPSDNAVTRQLLMSLGEARTTDPTIATERTSRARGGAVIRAWFRVHGIDDTGLTIDNGSGLSRSERIQPMQLATLLRLAYRGKWAPEFLSSLPIVGLDGTMRTRLRQSAAHETARIKTGTLRDVAAVAGYVNDAQGRPYVLVGLFNHPTLGSRRMRPLADALIEWVARQND